MPYPIHINRTYATRLCFIALLLLAGVAHGREYRYLNFSTKDGLAGDNIYSMVQDLDGFIWVATETGLSRFDGTSFKNYTAKDGLPTSEIIFLFLDKRGRIWIGPFKNEICYYENGQIHNKKNDPVLSRIPVLTETKSVAESADGSILIQADNCYVIIKPDNSFKAYKKHYQGPPLFKPVKGAGPFLTEIIDVHDYAIGKNFTVGFNYNQPSSANKYIFPNADSSVIYKGDQLIFAHRNPLNSTSSYLYSDSVYIYNTTNGSQIYNLNTGRYEYQLLNGIWTNHTLIDREGGIWIGTRGFGIFYLPPDKNFSLSGTTGNLPFQALNFYAASGQLIAGNNDSKFWLIDQQNYSLKGMLDPHHLTTETFYPLRGNMLRYSDRAIIKIVENIHISLGAPKTLAIADSKMIIALHDKAITVPLGDTSAETIWSERAACAYSANGMNYVGTLNGLYAFPEDGKVHSSANIRPVVTGAIVSLAYSYNNGLIWAISSDNGVYCIRKDRPIMHMNESNGLSSNTCTCIFTDGHRVIIGTNNGMNVISPENDFALDKYYILDGLASDNINCVYVTGNEAWVGTPKGVSIIDISRKQIMSVCTLTMNDISVGGILLTHGAKSIRLAPQQNDLVITYSGIAFRSMGKIKYTYRLVGLNDAWQVTTQNSLKYPSLPAGSYRLEIFATDRYGKQSNRCTIAITVDKDWWQYWWVQLSGGILIIFLTALIVRWQIRRVQRRVQEKAMLQSKIIELEQLALQAQMNPHFIFNSLNSFYQYVINKDLPGASKFMNDFSKLIRLLFEITSLKELPLDKEISFLATYLELEKTKLNNAFDYHVNIDPELPAEEITIPSFIIQPFVENSIRHGIQNRRDNLGEINISIFPQANALVVSIEDNGVGREYTARMREQQLAIHHSRGIALTTERIELYNKTHYTNITLVTTDRYHEDDSPAGTTVTITIPINDLK